MEIILLGIYAGIVWLVFIKFKLLPWTTPWKVGVAIFPIVMIAILLLLLNIFAPTTTDVRVVKYAFERGIEEARGIPSEHRRLLKRTLLRGFGGESVSEAVATAAVRYDFRRALSLIEAEE